MPRSDSPLSLLPTGVPGLDDILRGGFVRGRTYLVHGRPGTGKTTLALQFALEGVRNDERALFITLSQREEDLHLIAASHGWDLDGIGVRELYGHDAATRLGARQTVFPPADVELGELGATLRGMVEEAEPDRVVFDSIGALRTLADGGGRHYRDEVALLVEFLAERGATALFLDDLPATARDDQFQSLAFGAITLERASPRYGEVSRHIEVEKVRAHPFDAGRHNYRIREGGLDVFPRLQRPHEDDADGGESDHAKVPSGIGGLDAMLWGGLERGTSCLIIGPTGTGKSTTASLYVRTLLEGGEGAAIFLFDERPETFLRRTEGLGIDLRPYAESGLLHIEVIATGQTSPGEMAQRVREVIDGGARAIVIDSLTGYYHAMRDEELLLAQMREMLAYTSRKGVLALLVIAQSGIVGSGSLAPFDISYMGDTLILLRNYEAESEIRHAITVVKKRYGGHETGIREFIISEGGVEIGDRIQGMTGFLTGNPRPVSAPSSGASKDDHDADE